MSQLEINAAGLEQPARIDTRLSYSSATLLKNCEQRYFNYKVAKLAKDKDVEESNAFAMGKAFHHVLEMSMHKKPENIVNKLEECVELFGIEEEEIGQLHAMVLQYLRCRKQTELEAIACEYSIVDDNCIGFIDLIEGFREGDSWGDWYITDLKTARTFWATLTARLPQDRQLNLYASFFGQIAKEFGLDPARFKGCRYRVTTKTTAKQKKTESYNDYVMRLVEAKNVKSYDIVVPVEKLNINQISNEFESLYRRSIELRNGDVPTRNYSYCETYFKPCDYWSQCHGTCFSEMKDDLEVLKEA